MGSLLRIVVTTLSVAVAAPVGAPSLGTAAQAPSASPGSELQATVDQLELARQYCAKNRPADAQRELSRALDLLRAASATATARPTARAGGELPRGGRDVPMPGLLKRLEPQYPLEAAKQGITGQVIVDVVIDKSGRVQDARIARSVPELDRAALDAVRQWRFAKPTVNGAPGNVAATLVLAFTLRRTALPTDDIDLARFHAGRGDYAAADTALARALDTITRENECFASTANLVGARGLAGGGPIEPPRKIRDVKPVYPALVRKARVSGTVIMEAVIGVDGRVQCARVLKSVPLLDQSAIDAASQWEFTPARRAGVPVPIRLTMTVNFTLQ